MPSSECLKDTVKRFLPFWEKTISLKVKEGKKVMIVAHGNSLRAMMIELQMYKPEEISSIELPTGSPLCINLDNGKIVNFHYLN